jgi:hypothetical protein
VLSPALSHPAQHTIALRPGDLLAAGSADYPQGLAGLVIDAELGVVDVDVDVDQGVPMGVADAQPLPGDLGEPPVETRRCTRTGPET